MLNTTTNFMDPRLYFPATKRNRNHIGKILSKFLPTNGSILEIASGSGEHGVTFQKLFPQLHWQTSEPNPLYRESIRAWINYEGLRGIMPEPIDLDVEKTPWPITEAMKSSLKSIVCINLLHVTRWESTEAIFKEAKEYLRTDHSLIIYGPLKINGKYTSQSNELFDQSLKEQNNSWGLRELNQIRDISLHNKFKINEIVEMPANNHLVAFTKL